MEDASFEPPDGHRWLKAAPEDCPNCTCCSARLCKTAKTADIGVLYGIGQQCAWISDDYAATVGCPCTTYVPTYRPGAPACAAQDVLQLWPTRLRGVPRSGPEELDPE